MSLLEIKNLKKKYGEFEALKGLNFSVNAGEIVALLGKNGAGKTTLLNSIAGYIFPTSGDILYKGETLLKSENRLNEFGILIEPTFIPYLNAHDNLDILLKITGIYDGEENIDELLAEVGLKNKTREKTRAYSFGMKQRLGLAQALLNKPQFLILDEPFVGLDPIGKEIFKNIIIQKAREEKVGILFSSHDLEDVEEICDRIVLIDGGEKKFDGVMEYTKTYIAEYVSSDDGNKTEKLETEDQDEFMEILLNLRSSGVKIINLDIQKSSLYDLFKDG
jgi:ABC-2 type transport system ATP-binding protein